MGEQEAGESLAPESLHGGGGAPKPTGNFV